MGIILISIGLSACNVPSLVQKKAGKTSPTQFNNETDSTNSAQINWQDFFADSDLTALIDTALSNNQELNITLQEIEMSRFEIRARKGEYLPFVDFQGGAGIDKVGRYTSQGANDANTDIDLGRKTPDIIPDFLLGAKASWEIDIWRKLRNAKQSAFLRYQATIEGKNFMVTNLVAEIAHSYYELLALDNQLTIVRNYIKIQEDVLQIVKLEKLSARVTELAVRKFEAELFKNQSRQYYIQQQIIEVENRINFLVGRYPQPVKRSTDNFIDFVPQVVAEGLPSQLLENRPDIRQATQAMAASKLDVQVAKADFYPSIRLTAGLGFQAFNPTYFLKAPESMLFSFAGDLVAPLVNRNAIKANYLSANAKQIQAAFAYERTVLTAFTEVVNQLSKIDNLEKSYDYKAKQVAALTQSISISTSLFKSAKADYMEVLLTQRDALEAKIELVETKQQQMSALINLYQALGGGWK